MPFQPTAESVKQHRVPDWFRDAKLGIMVSWGLYSVPAYAPPTGQLDHVSAAEGWEYWFRHNPYAEWYWNSMRMPDNRTHRYHAATYGVDFPYEGFAPLFDEAVRRWDPAPWADLFQRAGARYVVPLTKHHDGYLLWPSRVPHAHKPGFQVVRDVIGELAEAVRARGMRLGLYYSGGLDWTFNDTLIRDRASLQAAVPQGDDYIAVADAHYHELIDRYQPSILWNDIAYPAGADMPAILAAYYNRVPDGAVNDRFVANTLEDEHASTEWEGTSAALHFDFRTPEYSTYATVTPIVWEAVRGIGLSFGYNRLEGDEHYLSVEQLVHLLADVVAKNGNLLLGVGPDEAGRIPAPQRDRLEGLGSWLAVNGEAIYGTRPWTVAEGQTTDGTPLRFTRGDDSLFAILLGTPSGAEVAIEGVRLAPEARVSLLAGGAPLPWRQDGQRVVVAADGRLPSAPAHAIKLAPPPETIAG